MNKIYLALAILLFGLSDVHAQGVTRLCAQSVNALTGNVSCPDVIPGQIPVNSAITGNASGTTGAVVGTLAAAVGKYTYICDFDISAIGGTAAVGPIVVSGIVGTSKTYQMSASAAGSTLSKAFTPCLQSSAASTAITITTTADGTATAVNVNSSGFQQ